MVSPPTTTQASGASGASGGGHLPKPAHKDPYFISSSDLPGNIITHVVLRSINYDEWSRSIKLSFTSRRKITFLEGTEPKPTNDPEKLFDWRCIQALLVQWVLNTIDPSIKKQISFYEEVYPLWDMLRKRYSASHATRKQQLKAELAACIQTSDMPVEEYLGKLQPIWEELHNLTPLPTCSCGAITEQLMAMRLEDRYHDFLYGLNREKFGSIRSSLNTQNPLPSLDTAYQKVREEESMRTSVESSLTNECVAFAMRSTPRSGEAFDRSKLVCSHCRKQGHDASNCFAKNGYPEWWESRNRRGGRTGPASYM